ncbi:NAD(P)H-dependent oxidoreductase [Neisseria yangbaofengii]|uniref:NAD(P)H-dependent oxidoreductase n=1 Tax=Neisseria yangbaofengii TaxID=2709396 RepID=UPI0013ED09A0|nr:NAD(P)H-dependent oxidoreductase [Neisseria yangbaofengii]
MNILIISGHPNLAQSVANQAILNRLAEGLPNAEIRRLDTLYSENAIDVASEQQALLTADVIVWQFPFYWYSLPALLKKYLDDVFLHGFAHGSTAKLGGKKLLLSFTTGAPEQAYIADAMGNIDDLLLPLKSTAKLCNLEWLPPVYTHGISYIARTDQNALDAQRSQAKQHAERVIAQLQALEK